MQKIWTTGKTEKFFETILSGDRNKAIKMEDKKKEKNRSKKFGIV